jgi:hypothetical protein
MPLRLPIDPANVQLMDVEKFLTSINAQEVTSHAIKDNANQFHPDGIFSELIFGQIGTSERMTKMGYINLSNLLPVLHPEVYNILISLKKLYEGILSGKQFAIFNNETKDFELATKLTANDSNTGYNFFIEHLNEIEYQTTASNKRKINIEILKKYQDRLLITKVPVLAAAPRDLKNEDERLTSENINKLYIQLLSLSQALPEKILEIELYNQLRYNIQIKVNQIYEKILDMLEGKRGFLLGKFGARAVAMSARNVITAAKMSGLSPDDPQFLRSDESAVPLIEGLKTSQPLIVSIIKQRLLDTIFLTNSYQITVIDPDNYNLVYITVNDLIKDKFVKTDQIENIINIFIDNPHFRFSPITITSADPEDKKKYYLYLIYEDNDDVIYVERSITTLKDNLKENFDINKIRPLTYIEFLYMATYQVTSQAHAFITRYPVTNAGGIYPSKIKTITTIPDKTVYIQASINARTSKDRAVLPHYPIIGKPLIDCVQLHPSRLAILDADHDGDITIFNYKK